MDESQDKPENNEHFNGKALFIVPDSIIAEAIREHGFNAIVPNENWSLPNGTDIEGAEIYVASFPNENGEHQKEIIKKTLSGSKSITLLDLETLDRWIAELDPVLSLHNFLDILDRSKTKEDPDPLNIWARPLDLSKIIFTPPPIIKYLFTNRLPLGRGSLLTGTGGSSKTRVLYHWGIGAITGQLWNWTVENTGKAVLILTEDTADDFHRVLSSVIRGLELSKAERQKIVDNLIAYPLAGKDTTLLTVKGGCIEKTDTYYQLEKQIIDIGNVVFVGLDPALSLTSGDELDQGHQRALGKMVDDLAVNTGATCVLVSHATKASLNSDELSSHNSRGGGAITDAVRSEFSMRNMTLKEANKAGIIDIEERKRHVQLVVTKANALPPSAFVPQWFRRDNSGTLHPVMVEFSTTAGPTKKALKALEVLCKLSEGKTCTRKDWELECTKVGIVPNENPNATKQSMTRIIDSLKKHGLIRPGVARGVWLPEMDSI